MNKKIGVINENVIKKLKLSGAKEIPIFIGDANIQHMKKQHPIDFEKYGNNISDIIANPTYLARNEKKKSVEYIKEYKVENDFVLVAVRVSGQGRYFARTMYVMADEKVKKYFRHNYFIKN